MDECEREAHDLLAELGPAGSSFDPEFVDAFVRTAALVRDLERRVERHLADGAASVTVRVAPFDPSRGVDDPDPRRARWVRATRCAVALVLGERGPGILLEVADDAILDRPYSRLHREVLGNLGFAPPRPNGPGVGSWTMSIAGSSAAPADVARRAVDVLRYDGLGGPLLPVDLAVQFGRQPQRVTIAASGDSFRSLTSHG